MASHSCPRCAHAVDAAANFCDQCRMDLRTTERNVQTDGFRWSRQPEEVAVRIASVDLKALLTKRLAVAEGTRGLLFQGEGLVEQLPPGPHTIESIPERLKSLLRQPMFSAALVDTSDIPLTFQSDGVMSRDGVDVSFRADLAVRVRHPVDFYVNVMKGRTVVRTQDLHDLIRPLLTASVGSVVRDCDASELSSPDPELLERLQDDLHAALDGRLTASGLLLERIDVIVFRNEGRDELLRLAAQFNQELRLKRLQRDRERLERERDQDWKRFLAGLEQEESLAAIEKARSERDFEQTYEDLAHEAKVSDLVRKERWESLCHDYQANKDDRDEARRHLVAQLDWQRRSELLQIEHDFNLQTLRSHLELEDVQRQQQIDEEAAEHRRQLRRNRDELEAELKADATRREHERSQHAEDVAAEIEEDAQRDEARRERETAQFQDEQQRRRETFDEDQHQAGRQADEELRVRKQQSKQENAELDAEVDRLQKLVDMDEAMSDRKAQRDDQAKEADHRRQRELAGDAHSRKKEEAQAERDYELDRLELMGSLPPEALMSLSGSEQAGLIAQLQETRILKDQTPDQILARSASGDREVARALADVFSKRGEADVEHSRQIEALYNRMLQEQQAAADRQAAGLKDALETVERVAGRGLDAARDVGIAAAGAGRPVVPPQPETAAPQSPSRDPECPDCGEPHLPDAAFCPACGADLE